MRRAIGLITVVLLTACGGAPERVAVAPASETAPVDSRAGPTLGSLLLELEANLQASALKASALKPAEVGTGLHALAKRLTVLEERLDPTAKVERWKARQPEWAEEVGAVATDVDLALCLAELEANLARSALSERWTARRPRWIGGLRSAAGLVTKPARERVAREGCLWVVRNRTQKLLLLRWSGPQEGTKAIGAGREVSIPLAPGHYVVRGSAPGVEPKISVHEFEAGFRYTQTFGVE